jgi:hypothetical protein
MLASFVAGYACVEQSILTSCFLYLNIGVVHLAYTSYSELFERSPYFSNRTMHFLPYELYVLFPLTLPYWVIVFGNTLLTEKDFLPPARGQQLVCGSKL